MRKMPLEKFDLTTLKRTFREWKKQEVKLPAKSYIEEIDLTGALMPGEGDFDAGIWADITGNLLRASMLLPDSPHVKFLEQYRAMGGSLFHRRNFEQTPYFMNAMDCVRFTGEYFNQRTLDGILAQARSFVTLYERMREGNSMKVNYALAQAHSKPGSLPVVRKTWTPTAVQIDDGCHRLAAAWALGRTKARAVVVSPPMPTELQYLVARVAQSERSWGDWGGKFLFQPIDSVEFDSSWTLVRRCHDRLEMMLNSLATQNRLGSGLSVLDLGCSYGWFVAQFAKQGCEAMGVDTNPAALKIGQIAYGLRPDQLVQSDLQTFLASCHRTFDVVLLLGLLQEFLPKSDFGNVEGILKQLDTLTESVLFLDIGQSQEREFVDELPQWDENFIIGLIKQHTSFVHVVPLGADSDNVGHFADNFGHTLFVCFRG